MKKLLNASLLSLIFLFSYNGLYAQKNKNALSEYDINHPAPRVESVSISGTKALVHLGTNTKAKYDIITCTNILTGENTIIRQASAETVYLNNLDSGSYFEVKLQHVYPDGEVSKTLQFCFSTELTTEATSMRTHSYVEAEK
ncbi:MAG: hypothetical protein ACKVPJ_10240 [Chitinophagales bacterium]